VQEPEWRTIAAGRKYAEDFKKLIDEFKEDHGMLP
jgi:hypothetical protein